jgi:hypothetical protein
MNRLFAVACIIILTCGCVVYKPVAIIGNYPKPPITYLTSTPFDKVWDNIIDMFSQQGLSIKIIDRSSGLIVSERGPIPYSFEDKLGKLYKPEAYAVIERWKENGGASYFIPLTVTGEWNVRIKTIEDKTGINVNLTSILATYEPTFYSITRTVTGPVMTQGKTTGIFEKIITDAVK